MENVAIGEKEQEARVLADCLERARHGALTGVFSGIAVAVAFAFLFRALASHASYWAWLAAMGAFFAVRVVELRRPLPATPAGLRRWAVRFEAAYLVVGILWGLSGFVFIPAGEPAGAYFVTGALYVIAVMSVAALSWHRRAFVAFSTPLFLLMGLPWFVAGSAFAWPVQLLSAGTYFVLYDYVRRNAVLLEGSVRMRYEREALLSRLAERTREAEAANEGKTRFLASASHDLRQPLHALGLLVAHASDLNRDPPLRSTLTQVQAMARTLGELIDALLDISRLDAGAVKPALRTFAVQPLLDAVAGEVDALAEDKGLQLRVRRTDAWTRSDPVLLARIVGNLVANAIKYTESGGALLAARVRGGRLLVEVWDTGLGIADTDRTRIFEEFVQLDNPMRDRARGTGLGLSIVSRLARLLEHPLQLASRPGRGSVFRLSLPLLPAPAPDAAGAPRADIHDVLEGRCVMVIEDDAAVLSATTVLLAGWRCRVLAAEGVAAAVALLEDADAPLDLILTDQRLGRSSGVQAVEILRSLSRRPVPALIVTGDAPLLREALELAPPMHVLAKPVAPVTLRAALAQMLRADAAARATGAAPRVSPGSANSP